MTSLRVLSIGGACAVATLGCDAILGVHPHALADEDAGAAIDAGGVNTVSTIDASPGASARALCGDSGPCLFGGIVSSGPPAGGVAVGQLPGGGVATLTDVGFELGGPSCDDGGIRCVTGSIVP